MTAETAMAEVSGSGHALRGHHRGRPGGTIER
jgi:hypothetical protein